MRKLDMPRQCFLLLLVQTLKSTLLLVEPMALLSHQEEIQRMFQKKKEICAFYDLNRFAALTWDPIFEPLKGEGGDGRTYAEMTKDEKNKISHRSKALNLFKDFLVENPSLWDGSAPK